MILLIGALVVISGFFAGLILSFMGLDVTDLERKAKLGDKQAAKILPLRKKGNQLLSTLMMCNVFLNAAISSCITEHSGGIFAVLASGALILVFGDIVPTAICNKYKMPIAYHSRSIVYIMLWVCYPITYPLSYVLNKWLHVEMVSFFSKNEIKAIIEAHENEAIDNDEKKIIIGGLTYSTKIVTDIMTPVTQVYRLNVNKEVTLEELKNENYGRIPVYSETRDNIIGILYLKYLIGVEGKSIKVSDYVRKGNIIRVMDNETLDNLMNIMTTKHNHMSFVYDEYGSLRGIVTLEDIIETIIDREILDETDSVADLQQQAKNNFQTEMDESAKQDAKLEQYDDMKKEEFFEEK